MPTPSRFTSGLTQATRTQPLGAMGAPDPFFYNIYAQDFNFLPATNQHTVTTVNGSGAMTQIAGDGGIAQLSTGATTPAIGDNISEQLPAGIMNYTAGKRMFFACEVALNNVTTYAMRVGLMAITTTPFTGAPDGIYFVKGSGTTAVTLQSSIGGVVTSVAIPAAAIGLANNVYVNLCFQITNKGEVEVYTGQNLFGYSPQSGTGTQPTPPFPGGPVARLTPTGFTTALLSPTLGVFTNAASTGILTCDYVMAAKER